MILRDQATAVSAYAAPPDRRYAWLEQNQSNTHGAGYHGDDLIVCQPDGSLWKSSALTSAYRALLQRRGLDGPNFHALRPSQASQLLRDHADLKTVQCRLGHKKASFTLEVYGHLLPGQDEEAARRMDLRLRKAMEDAKKPKGGPHDAATVEGGTSTRMLGRHQCTAVTRHSRRVFGAPVAIRWQLAIRCKTVTSRQEVARRSLLASQDPPGRIPCGSTRLRLANG